MTDTLPLFDGCPVPAAPAEAPTPGAVRRRRQLECMARGLHPLSSALRTPIRLHPDAAPVDDRTAPGLRCGGCVHRVTPNREVAGRYPKCDFGGRWQRASAGPGTDVKAHWPACVDFEEKNDG